MAAGPFDVYEIALNKILKADIDLNDDTYGAMLLLTAHTPNLSTHAFVTDIVGDECGDGDYARQAITGNAMLGPTAGESFFDCDNIDFGNSVTIGARYLVIYRNIGPDVDATSEVCFICDLNSPSGPDLESTAGNFDIAIAAAGVHKFTPNV